MALTCGQSSQIWRECEPQKKTQLCLKDAPDIKPLVCIYVQYVVLITQLSRSDALFQGCVSVAVPYSSVPQMYNVLRFLVRLYLRKSAGNQLEEPACLPTETHRHSECFR